MRNEDHPHIANHAAAAFESGTSPATGTGAPLRWRTFAALIILPALWAALLIARYGVNVPYYDQWIGMAPVFESMEAGALGVSDFTLQHNEHRLPIPRLIFFAAGLLTHWDTRVEMFLTWTVLVVIAANLWKLLSVTGWRAGPRTQVLFALVGIFVFTPLQQQNLLNGFQLHFVMPLAFVTAGLWTAVSLRHPWNFAVTALLATAATFSMASGLLSWLFILPVLVFCQDRPPGRAKWFALWGAVFLVNVIVFFIGYRLPPTSAAGLLRHPVAGLCFFLTYLGTPFAWGPFALPWGAPMLGAVLLLLIVAAAGAFWVWRKEAGLFNRSLPWMLVAATGLVHGVLTTAGRLHLGLGKALESRYVTCAIMVPIGLLVVGALVCERLAGARPGVRTWTMPGLVGLGAILLAFHGFAVFQQLGSWPGEKHDRLFVKAAVQMIDVVDEPQIRRYVSPAPTRLRDTVHALARLRYLQPPPLASRSIAAVGDPAEGGKRSYGMIDQSAQEGNRIAVLGWAILPEMLLPADAVLLTYDDDKGVPTIFALVEVVGSRPDVAALTGAPDLANCGWRSMFSTVEIPASATVIKAWAYDAEQCRAWRLAGSTVARR